MITDNDEINLQCAHHAPNPRHIENQPIGTNIHNNHTEPITTHDEEDYHTQRLQQIIGEILEEDESLIEEFFEAFDHNINNNTNPNENNNNNNININLTNNAPTSLYRDENIFQGDRLDRKAPNHIRFLFQNINGLHAPKLHKWLATINKILELEIDITALCETCINWRKNKVKQKYQASLNTKSSFGKLVNPNLVTSPIDIPYQEDRVPGGTAMITAGKWTSRIERPIKDLFSMGRWCGNIFRLSGNKRLHLITAYRPCPTRIGITTSLSTAHQQTVKLQQRKINNSTPRKQFVIDFINQFYEICNDPNELVILALDANSNLTEDIRGLKILAQECNFIDLFNEIHPQSEEFATQARGSKRIDYMLGTRNVLPYISKIGYLPFNDGFDSDHRASYMDISPTILETDTPDPIQKYAW
jgi:hypothetical protein